MRCNSFAAVMRGVLLAAMAMLVLIVPATAVQAQTVVNICSRTAEVETALLTAIGGSATCSTVTDTQLASVTTLEIFGYSNSSVLPADFAGLTGLTSLTFFFSTALTTVPDDAFADLTSLETLTFTLFTSKLTTLGADAFDGLTSLTTLDLNGNSLTTLDEDIFDGTALETLNLSGNSLTTLDEDIFDGLTNLATLNLSSNLLTTLPADIFDGLTNLATLELSSNLLTTLDADIFDGTALVDLRLGSNSLTALDANIFDGLTAALEVLDLNDNSLTALPVDIFDGLTGLQYLDLSCNYFTTLDLDIFNPFAATLTYLDLRSDSFTTPPDDTAIEAKFTDPNFLLLAGAQVCSRVKLSPTSLTVAEGSTGMYSVALRSQPGDDVTVAITSDNTDVTVSPTSLTFSTSNWDTAQTLTVSAAQDTDEADESATLILDPSGGGYDDADDVVSTALTVTVTDDDGPGLTVTPTSLTIAEGSTGTYTVELNTQPTAQVTVAIGSDNSDVTTSLTMLTFTTSNWNSAQTVTVSAAQDADTADDTAVLTLNPSGADYASVSDVTVTVTVTDDDGYGLTVTPTSLTIAEGSTGTYTVELNTQPTAQVTVAIGSDNSDVTTSLTMLTFTTSNWNSAQTVTVSAAQDADTADDTAVLTLNPSGADYASVSDVTVTVTVTDDDLPGICGRTEAVRMAILGEITGSPTCSTVTDTQLASIPRLEFFDYPNSSILPADFAGLTGLTFLSLIFSPVLTTVPDDAFADLTDLEYLAIASSPTLTTLGADAFDGLTNLEDLLLEFNGLTTLDEDIFDGLDGLEDLRLNGNSLTALDEDIFDGLTNLDTLKLDGNDLTTLPADIFDGLTNLADLQLFGNDLTTLDADIFDGLTNLATLNLSSNLLTTLPADIFDGLTNLATLELSSNLLTTLDADIFDGTDLTDLRISSNSLRTLDTDIFAGLTALEVLKLDDNSLTALPVDIFDGLTSLDFLDLNCNYFTTLDLDIFNPFAATLTYLDLQSDSFTTPLSETAIRAKFTDPNFFLSADAPVCSRVKLSPTSLTVAEGSTGMYSVALRSEPDAQVTVAITSDNTDVTVSPTSLTFLTSNWDTAQPLTVSVAQDTDEADESATLILDPSGSGSGDYDFASSTALAVAVKDDDIAVTVSFESDTYTAAEGGDVTVTVELSAEPQRSVTVPITTSNQGGASSDDYDVPDDVTFGAAERSTTFTFTATQDMEDDDDESVKLGFGTIADTNVSAGTPAETTVSITDDDHPRVTVSFEESTYSADEGGTVDVEVQLSADPERTVSIPITKTEEDGASSADYSGVPDNVMFNAGEESKTITFMATNDDFDDDDESVKLGFGPITDARVSEGTTIETTVSIKDDDHPRVTVSFEESTYSADEGGTVEVTVELSADPERTVSIPITKTEQDGASSADYSGVPDNVMFNAGEESKTITFAATQDTLDDDDESVKLGFGTITDARVSEGTPAETTVSITDDDVPQVTVSFKESAYSANEAGTGTADVTVQLSADPERTVTIDILTTNQDGASSADYSGVPSSVTFNAGGVREMTFTITATDDALNDDGESVLLGFGGLPSRVGLGTNAQATFTINDDDGAGVTVSTVSGSSGSALTISEGGSGTYTVVLDSQPTADVTVTIHDPSGSSGVTAGVTAEPASLTFNTSNWSSSQSVTVNAAQDSDAKDGTATVTHTVASDDSDYDGTPAAKVRVVVRDDDDIAVTVSFGRATYSVAEGGSVTVEVALSEDPKRTVSIPITKTEQDGASSADYSGVPDNVTFNAGETSKTISFAATQDTENDDGESVKLAFGNITDAQVSAGTPAETTVSITDDDVPDVTVSFGEMSYTVAEGGEVEVTVELSEAPERRVEIPLTVANLGGASDADYKEVETPVVFESGDTEQTFLFMALADTETEEDEMVEIKVVAESLPLGVTPGSPATTTVTITESGPPPSRRPPPTLSRVGGGGGGGGGEPEPEPEPVGYLENPGPASFQSGIGVISGWVCEADRVEIEIETAGGAVSMLEAAYGTERLDTARMCEDTDNGFGLLFNWNLLGDGEHEVAASVDGVELGRATVTVTTLGVEFLRGVEGACMVDDFPSPGQTVTLEWQQTSQNFVIASGTAPTGESRVGSLDVGFLENPGPNSFQSGIGVISGWVCEAEEVEVEIGNLGRQLAGYGTERLDTLEVCGDTDNGFGLLFNWNLLGDGEHTVEAFVDSVELGRATVRVTTLGEEFLRGAERECVVEDFPMLEAAVTLEWQQSSQNFVITDME